MCDPFKPGNERPAQDIHIGNNMSWSNNLRNVNDSYRYLDIITSNITTTITTYEQHACDYRVRVLFQYYMFM